jgi:hypothetical protein
MAKAEKSLLTLLDNWEIVDIEQIVYPEGFGGPTILLYVESRTNEDTIMCQFEIPMEHAHLYVNDFDPSKYYRFTSRDRKPLGKPEK